MIGKLDVEGVTQRGEAELEKGLTVADVAQERTEEVEREPLPVEFRDHVRTYYQMLVGEGSGEGK